MLTLVRTAQRGTRPQRPQLGALPASAHTGGDRHWTPADQQTASQARAHAKSASGLASRIRLFAALQALEGGSNNGLVLFFGRDDGGVDVETTRAIRQAEVGAARTMIARTQDRFGLWPARLAADSAYGSAENLAWLVHERGIEPHIPVFDKSQRSDGTFSRSDFAYDHKHDRYICPAGKELSQYRRRFGVSREGVDPEGFMRYRASKFDCDACELKPRCSPNTPARKIMRSIHEGARDMARDITKTDARPFVPCRQLTRPAVPCGTLYVIRTAIKSGWERSQSARRPAAPAPTLQRDWVTASAALRQRR